MAQSESAEMRIGPQGRVVIPVILRRALVIKPGQVMVGRVEDGRLVLERREAILNRLQARFSNAVPRDVSLADELVADRRDEERREAGEE
jgi:bifunctional DNA-binding transcriptional regulator/antitoxin component of YhaV-PrlF toxin-antitoxin module